MRRSPPLLHQVERFLSRHPWPGGGVVVAVSGGPDSVALARALVELRGDATVPLVIAHLNHQLRGAESDAEEAFVGHLVDRLRARGVGNLDFVGERVGVAARASAERGNLEAVARRVRYDWLTRVARARGCGAVATGHTADDQAETVLHRLVRGTGIQGLRGVAAVRPLADQVLLIRPLLAVRRPEVLAYLQSLDQSSCSDSSNVNRDYTRNRIRHDLVPLLAGQYNPEIVPALCRLAEQAEAVYAAEEEEARRLGQRAELPRAGGALVFDAEVLRAAPRPRVCEVFRLAWAREGWPRGRMGYAEWGRLADLVLNDAGTTDLPGRIRATRRGRVVRIGRVS